MAAEARTVNPLVEQFQRGGVPPELRLLAAQGALPLKPADLVDLLQLLVGDADAEVAQAAVATLKAMPKEELTPIVKDRLTQPDCSRGYLFDGFPRTIPQADAMKAAEVALDYVVEIDVPEVLQFTLAVALCDRGVLGVRGLEPGTNLELPVERAGAVV